MKPGVAQIIAIVLLCITVCGLGMHAYGTAMTLQQREGLLKDATLIELQDEWQNQSAKDKAIEIKGLEDVIEKLKAKLSETEKARDSSASTLEERELLVTELRAREASLRTSVAEREAAEAELRQNISDLLQKVSIAKSAEEMDRLNDELEAEKLKRNQNNEEAKREQQLREQQYELHKAELADYKVKIDQLQRALAEYQNLSARREEGKKELYDGSVLEVDADRMVAVIDLGDVNRVSRGMRFDVIRWRENRWDRVGSVEITKVFASTATVMIINDIQQRLICPLTGFIGSPGMLYSPYIAVGENQDKVVPLTNLGTQELTSMKRQDPIVKGDLITNPFYSRDRILNFTIAGEPSEYSQEELVTLIEKYGGKTLKEITVETDYLVLCMIPDQSTPDKKQILEESKAAQDMAKQYGIPVMREIELLQFLRH